MATSGKFLLNRIIWTGVGLAILLYTYFRFSFEKFFSGTRDKVTIDGEKVTIKNACGKHKFQRKL